ncbi:hypothetical protein PFISCL1PPCAC_25586, partial [Pristionchus fissidentatus]
FSILLASSSSILNISLKAKDCSFLLSADRKSLIIEKVESSRKWKKSITGMEMQLTSDSENEILSSLLLPIPSPSSLVSIRIDAFYPLIFGSGETIKSADEILSKGKSIKRKKLAAFSLDLTPIHSRWIVSSLPNKISSDILKIGSTTLPVSREV